MDLNQLRTFHLVAKLGSLAAAARALGVPTSTVSRQLNHLEDALGVSLLHRPRQARLTDAGEALFAKSGQPLEELLELASALPFGEPRGTLHISVPSHLALVPWFGSLLLEFRRKHPEVDLDVSFSAGRLDFLEDGLDVALRPREVVPDSTELIARALPPLPVGLFAAPDYVQRHAPADVDALRSLDFIAARHLAGEALTLRRGQDELRFTPEPAMVGDDLSFVLPVVLAGGGYAPIPEPYAQPLLLSGRLAPLMAGWHLEPIRPVIVWPRRRFVLPRVRAFVDFALDAFERQVGLESRSGQ